MPISAVFEIPISSQLVYVMAEGLSHRLNEYLKTGQTTEEVNYTASADKNQDGGFRKSSNWEGQRSQNHERRSSLTRYLVLAVIFA